MEEDLKLTPQEERLLRRFFRRHALPYIAGVGAAAVLCLALALTRGDDPAPPAPPTEPAGDAAALGELRADLDRAFTDLAEVRARAREQAGEAKRSATALEQRLAAVIQRIEEVESLTDATHQRVDEALARAAPAALPPAPDGEGPSAADPDQLRQVLQRLNSLELRSDQEESRQEAAKRSNLERLDGVETRLFDIEKALAARSSDASQPPAAADPR